jgi:uncharacterized membrane protein
MSLLIAGLVLFIAMHSLRIFADGWRGQMVARMGAMPWKGLVSVVSLIGFVLMVMGYAAARQSPIVIWTPPFWLSHLVSLVMLAAFILLIAAYIPRNGIKARLGHPMVISVKIWALAHLLVNGTVADLLLFGALLIWAVMSFRAARQRDRREGAVRVKGELLMTLITVVVGALAWVWFVFQGHAWLIGVRPILMGS